jgi:hypothetical protein
MKNVEFLIPVLSSILGAAIVLLAQNTFLHPMPPIATVDLDSLLNDPSFIAHMEGDNLQALQVGSAVDQAIQETANAHNVIIMVRPAVLKGAPDLTLETSHRLYELLN